jgi:hypothetical protein
MLLSTKGDGSLVVLVWLTKTSGSHKKCSQGRVCSLKTAVLKKLRRIDLKFLDNDFGSMFLGLKKLA